ncbi:E3 ubiquitin-protein ligase TRIM7-like, partial [Notechis scutatus]|uniref:E3 ubiquitin-protein ligase TRIM7-like n=1 Tax=Notechis scutatus TaxID=8663 RepID=A0A6J1VYK4_9SAUR
GALPFGTQEWHPLLRVQDLLDGLLEPLRKEEQKLLEQRQAEEQSRQECQELLAAEKQEVGLLLESLQELLRERQPVWLGWLAEQEKMESEWAVTLAQLSRETSCLQQLMAQTERKCRQPDGEFLQDIQDTVDRCRSYMVGRVKSVSPRLQGRLRTLLEKNASVRRIVNSYKASLQATLTRKNLERPLITGKPPGAVSVLRPAAFVRPDGSTAHPRLLCKGSSVTWADRYQNYPDVPGRFDREFCVLGCVGFNTGWHWWEVSVQVAADNAPVRGKACWAIGVAKESVRRKGTFQLSPQEGIWAMGKSVRGEIVTFDTDQQKLSLKKPLQRLRVRLDCEAKEVEFLDAETEDSLHTFQMGPLLGETLRPFFYLGQEGVTLYC